MKKVLAVFNSVAETLLYVLMLLLLVMNIVGLKISANNAAQAKQLAAQAKILAAQNNKIAADSQVAAVVARQQNADRQEQLKSYIKCIVLLKFNPMLSVNSPEPDVSAALDNCAITKE